MSYYEKRIADLEARVAEMARMQRMKVIPVEAKLLERYALMQAENTRLRKAGDGMEEVIWLTGCVSGMEIKERAVKAWKQAKEGKPSV